jgi:hypothetical protein
LPKNPKNREEMKSPKRRLAEEQTEEPQIKSAAQKARDLPYVTKKSVSLTPPSKQRPFRFQRNCRNTTTLLINRYPLHAHLANASEWPATIQFQWQLLRFACEGVFTLCLAPLLASRLRLDRNSFNKKGCPNQLSHRTGCAKPSLLAAGGP